MRGYRSLLIGLMILVSASLAPSLVFGQRDLDYDHVVIPQDRIDARALGYPPLDVIPDGESGTTSLTTPSHVT